MKIRNHITFLLLISTINAMGQYIGVYAKKDGNLCFEKPIFTEEDTQLNNKLRSSNHQLNELKELVSLDNKYWNGMTFSEDEIKALKCNFVQDNADGDIEYSKSNGTPLDKDFYAIGTSCNSEHCFVYDAKYKRHENWAKTSTAESAIVKMIKILHERIKKTEEVTDYLLYDYENLNMLYGIIIAIKELYKPDEIAIIIAP